MDWAAHFKTFFKGAAPKHLAVAVSGGSDSLALLHLMQGFCASTDLKITALSVDHKLRPESFDEIAMVATVCAGLGVPHVALSWDDWDGTGNLQDAARRGRYGLMADWVRAHTADGLVLGHTADDQAETVLMRLARTAGVDGLSAMAPMSTAYGMTLYRPLLEIRRQNLRDYLTANGQSWADDPSNDQLKYDRVKMRQALDVLDPLGITVGGLTDIARYMADARDALNIQTADAARHMCTVDGGEVHLDNDALSALPSEIKRRLLVKALGWVGQGGYAPRRDAVDRVLQAIDAHQKSTLEGCVIRWTRSGTIIYRELNAIGHVFADIGSPWDGRWQVDGPDGSGITTGALGQAAVQSIAGWRDAGLTLEQVSVHPGVWQNGALIAAPTLQIGTDYTAKPLQSAEDFISSLLSH